MAHMAPQQGMNWRDYMGAIICLIGYKVIFNEYHSYIGMKDAQNNDELEGLHGCCDIIGYKG